jgi:uncharacterized protein
METTRIPQVRVEMKTNPLTALSARLELVVADPDPLGVFGFAFATFLANLSTLGVYSFNATWLSTMIFLGGLAELIAGIQDYKRNNIFGATVFSFFGVGWMGNAITAWLVTLKIVPETDPISQGWSCLFWAVFVAAMTGASLKLTKVLTVILVFVTLLELLLALGSFTGVMFITRAGAACGCIAAVLGLYLATADLWNLTFGRTVLPVGEWKR